MNDVAAAFAKLAGALKAPVKMATACLAAAVLAVMTACSRPALPDTPAGQTLAAMLAAFNSRDPDQLAAFYRVYQPDQGPYAQLRRQAQAGGLRLLSTTHSAPLHVEAVLQEENTGLKFVGTLDVEGGRTARITSWFLRPVDESRQTGPALDAQVRARVIDKTLSILKAEYVAPESASKMEMAIRAHELEHDYDDLSDGEQFANVLTTHLRDVSHDKHLGVRFSAVPLAGNTPAQILRASTEYHARMRSTHCGFQRVERLTGGIGYIKLDAFEDPSVCRDAAMAAMHSVADSRALIFDVRDCPGGNTGTIALIDGYLFPQPVQLSGIVDPKGLYTHESWTRPPGRNVSMTSRHLMS
jgi:hypothetical protein